MNLTFEQIRELQKQYGVTSIQEMIDNGMAWKMEGSIGRHAMSLLKSGICMLPEKQTKDYYGNIVPARTDLEPGTKGTLENAIEFWSNIKEGDFDAIELLQQLFGSNEDID